MREGSEESSPGRSLRSASSRSGASSAYRARAPSASSFISIGSDDGSIDGDVRRHLYSAIAMHGPRVLKAGRKEAKASRAPKKDSRDRSERKQVRSRTGESHSGSKRYVGTLNNPAADADEFFKRFAATHCVFWAGAHEVGASGTPHIQYFFDLLKPRTIKSLSTEFEGKLGHLEVRRGSILSNEKYCSKSASLTVHGELPAHGDGHRSDLEQFHTDVKSPLYSMLDLADRAPANFYRFNRSAQLVRGLARAEQFRAFRDVKVFVYWGDAGSGKTRAALTRSPGAFVFPPVTASGVLWADGLGDHKEVVLDDFDWSIPFAQMLRILDGHPLQLPVKGGHVHCGYTTVYITSNFHPSSWYPANQKNRDALTRRIFLIKKFSLRIQRQVQREPRELGSDDDQSE